MPHPSEVTLGLHVAGATVPHQSPFGDLVVPVSPEPLDPAIRNRWVTPIYQAVPGNLISVEEVVRPLLAEVSPELITSLLAQFNWRDRRVGAFFVALDERRDFEEVIGRLLLRSDVCYAGAAYCVALARLNTPTAVDFLQQYLGYYLTRKDLWFDQAEVMAALIYLDEVNGTAHARVFDELWRDFVKDKSNWNLAETCSRFTARIRELESFCARR